MKKAGNNSLSLGRAAGIAMLGPKEDCGHWPHVEQRDEFVAAVKAFLGLEELLTRLV